MKSSFAVSMLSFLETGEDVTALELQVCFGIILADALICIPYVAFDSLNQVIHDKILSFVNLWTASCSVAFTSHLTRTLCLHMGFGPRLCITLSYCNVLQKAQSYKPIWAIVISEEFCLNRPFNFAILTLCTYWELIASLGWLQFGYVFLKRSHSDISVERISHFRSSEGKVQLNLPSLSKSAVFTGCWPCAFLSLLNENPIIGICLANWDVMLD